MSKRLEDQLIEARAALDAAKAEHARVESEIRAAVEKATAAHAAAFKEAERLSEIHRATEYKVSDELEIAHHNKDGTRRWHAAFLKRVAAEVGFPFSERSKIDPKNESYSLYERALSAVYNRTVEAHSDVRVALKLSRDASAELHQRYRERSDAERPEWHAANVVRSRERDVREIEAKIAGKLAEKKAIAEAPKGSLLDPEFETKAKAARAKLREMVEGKKKP